MFLQEKGNWSGILEADQIVNRSQMKKEELFIGCHEKRSREDQMKLAEASKQTRRHTTSHNGLI